MKAAPAVVAEKPDTMAFAFMVSRHGARAPLLDDTSESFADDLALFPVEAGMLTASGMR